MKVRFNTGEDSDGLERHHLIINDKYNLRIQSLTECPEDAIIGRDLIGGDDILRYMKMAYEAGKNGEEFIVETGDIED